jgi:hypothetical protein
MCGTRKWGSVLKWGVGGMKQRMYWLKTYEHLEDILKNILINSQSDPTSRACARVLRCTVLPLHMSKI